MFLLIFTMVSALYHKNPSFMTHDSLSFQAIRIGSVVPTGVSHTTSRPCKFKGYDIPAGIIVMPFVVTAQHDPEVFPEPLEFKPERFLDEGGKLKMPLKYNPFGMGMPIRLYDPQRWRMYLLKYAPNEDSNQSAHPRRLIWVFVVRMQKLRIFGYPNCAQCGVWF